MIESIGTLQPFEFEFEKYQGLGNDFIFISSQYLPAFNHSSALKKFVQKICQRRYSVGADGVIFYDFCHLSQNAKMLIVNSDGSFAGSCGNAIRCLGLALFQKKLWDGKSLLSILRLSLPLELQTSLEKMEAYLLDKNAILSVLTNITFETNTQKAEVTSLFEKPKKIEYWQNFFHSKIQFKYDPVFIELENPHLVFFSEEFINFDEKDYCEFGTNIQKDFNVNIGMLQVENLKNPQNSYQLYVYERGAGLTLACGTGALACAFAAEYVKEIDSLNEPFILKMPGGFLKIQNTQAKIGLCAEAEFLYSARMRVASA